MPPGVIRSLISEYLSHSDRDIVVLAAQILETFRRLVHQGQPVLLVVLQVFHPGALEALILPQKVCLAGQAVSCIAEALNEAVFEVLLDAVDHATVEHVVGEAIREHQNNITVLDIVHKLVSIVRVVAHSGRAALVGKVVRLLLRRCSEVPLQRVV